MALSKVDTLNSKISHIWQACSLWPSIRLQVKTILEKSIAHFLSFCWLIVMFAKIKDVCIKDRDLQRRWIWGYPKLKGSHLWFYCHKTPWLSLVNKNHPPPQLPFLFSSFYLFQPLQPIHSWIRSPPPRRGITPYDTQTCCLILSWFGRRLNRHRCPMSKPEKQWPLSNTLRENVTYSNKAWG